MRRFNQVRSPREEAIQRKKRMKTSQKTKKDNRATDPGSDHF